jgi:hypothetical protein
VNERRRCLQDNKGVFNIDFTKWDKVPRPRILDNDRDACAICVIKSDFCENARTDRFLIIFRDGSKDRSEDSSLPHLIKVFFTQYVDNKGVFNIDFTKWDKVPRPRILDISVKMLGQIVFSLYFATDLKIEARILRSHRGELHQQTICPSIFTEI